MSLTRRGNLHAMGSDGEILDSLAPAASGFEPPSVEVRLRTTGSPRARIADEESEARQTISPPGR